MRRALFVGIITMLCVSSTAALARPYRLIAARTPRSTAKGNLELGLRYQGLFGADGVGGLEPEAVQQVAATGRWGILDQLELELELATLVFHNPGDPEVRGAFGDVRLGLQGRVLHTRQHLLALYAAGSFPTGPSDVDTLPPFWSDGTWDIEALLLYELVASKVFRVVVNAGYERHGTRDPATLVPRFDVPDAVRWNVACAAHLGQQVQLSLEVNGRHFLEDAITPVWVDNNHLVELVPGLRVEIVPRLVFEAGVGVALTRDSRQIYAVRALGGLTYEFNMY